MGGALHAPGQGRWFAFSLQLTDTGHARGPDCQTVQEKKKVTWDRSLGSRAGSGDPQLAQQGRAQVAGQQEVGSRDPRRCGGG